MNGATNISKFYIIILAFAILSGQGPCAQAVEPNEVLSDPVLETRARTISAELRCLVCQNQSIDDSNAPLARDLRILVRERLMAGDSNKETINYIVSRYGEFVLLRPRFGSKTVILWLAPVILLLIALFGLYLGYRARNPNAGKVDPEVLSPLEQEQIKKMLSEK